MNCEEFSTRKLKKYIFILQIKEKYIYTNRQGGQSLYNDHKK